MGKKEGDVSNVIGDGGLSTISRYPTDQKEPKTDWVRFQEGGPSDPKEGGWGPFEREQERVQRGRFEAGKNELPHPRSSG